MRKFSLLIIKIKRFKYIRIIPPDTIQYIIKSPITVTGNRAFTTHTACFLQYSIN